MNKAIEEINQMIVDNSQKQQIFSFFDNEVAAYVELLIKLEKDIARNPALLDTAIQTTLNEATMKIIKRGYELGNTIGDKKIIDKIKNAFRETIMPWMSKSLIMYRGLTKPKGYPGDFQMLEYIYNGVSISQGIGKYFDEGFLTSDLTQAVINRKNMMREQLIKEISKPQMSILNLACGSCREIRELPETVLTLSPFFDCVDFDSEALEYSKNKLASKKIDINYVKGDIIEVIKDEANELFHNKDIIYSIGLIDYLPDRILKRIIASCLKGLKSRGKIILTIKDRDVYNPIREDWLTDWKFIPRNNQDIDGLIKEVGGGQISLTEYRDESQIIIFLVITKN
ncbi:MAG: class I SAM-dependent methyltransferase [Candidatus Margulisbacteria bacterium]|nr:class I SAM-dependent methyltransferase [Candidatus Margulisiibacteriota bacterium]